MAVVIKLTAPYWFPYVRYDVRIYASILCMVIAMILVGSAPFMSSDSTTVMAVQLMGVGFMSIQSGIGEVTFLALAGTYGERKRQQLTMWSSGTGLAGLFGYFVSTL